LNKIKIISWIHLIRVKQWIKNLFVFLPMFFNKQFTSTENLAQSTIAFLAFSFTASAIYCINDLKDKKLDQLHPQKKNRPIASGIISKPQAIIAIAILCFIALFISLIVSKNNALFIVLFVYFILNIMYTFKLKNIIFLDIFMISISFVLRLFAGAVTTNTYLSNWIIVMVVLLTLFLALLKRKDEVILYQKTSIIARKNISRYSLKVLTNCSYILCLCIITTYLFYTLNTEVISRYDNKYIFTTTSFVILGLVRYMHLVNYNKQYANPSDVLIRDKKLLLIILGWVISFYIIIYL